MKILLDKQAFSWIKKLREVASLDRDWIMKTYARRILDIIPKLCEDHKLKIALNELVNF